MKFDYIIGNPPYQEEVENNGRKNPIYNYFMDAAYELGGVVELITPARFLFNAGQTPKGWNQKMLNDPHLKVLDFEQDSSTVFANTDIKGGVVITYRDTHEEFGPIGTFIHLKELNTIKEKVACYYKDVDSAFLNTIVSPRGNYRLTSLFFDDFPEAVSRLGKGTGNMIVSNIFEKIPEAFSKNIIEEHQEDYLKILGRSNHGRVYRYLKREYLIENEFIDSYNVLLPEANGIGKLGEVLSAPLIAQPLTIATDTFISIGTFETQSQAKACLKYIKSKFARTLLGVLKITQHNPKAVWACVPIQDFTSSSDIDWSQSVADIDQQLYAKYSLSENEIAFIESHVKEME